MKEETLGIWQVNELKVKTDLQRRQLDSFGRKE